MPSFKYFFISTGKLEHCKEKMIKIQYMQNRVFSLQFAAQEKDESSTNTYIENIHSSLRGGNSIK